MNLFMFRKLRSRSWPRHAHTNGRRHERRSVPALPSGDAPLFEDDHSRDGQRVPHSPWPDHHSLQPSNGKDAPLSSNLHKLVVKCPHFLLNRVSTTWRTYTSIMHWRWFPTRNRQSTCKCVSACRVRTTGTPWLCMALIKGGTSPQRSWAWFFRAVKLISINHRVVLAMGVIKSLGGSWKLFPYHIFLRDYLLRYVNTVFFVNFCSKCVRNSVWDFWGVVHTWPFIIMYYTT